jgi:hypothetical protein
MTERDRGTGSVSPHRGAWRARLPGAYARRSLGVYATEEEAHAVLDAALVALRASPPLEETVGQWGAAWLTAREEAGHHKRRTLGRDRTRWAGLVEGSLLARVPLLDVSELDVRRWLASLRRQDAALAEAFAAEHALALCAYAEGAEVREGPLCVAVPVVEDPREHRVIVVNQGARARSELAPEPSESRS